MIAKESNITYDYDGNIIPLAKKKGNLSQLSKPK